MGLLDRAGAEMTSDVEAAEILVVNTCSFIDAAKQESVDTILEMAQHKTAGRARRLIVAGCLVERYRDEIRKNIPEVDAVVGTGELEEILAAAGLDAPAEPIADSPFRILNTGHRAQGTGLSCAARGRSARVAGAVCPDGVGWRRGASAAVSLRPHHAAAAGDQEGVGVYQDCGRLRSSVQLLRDSEPAGQVPVAAV